MIKRILAVLAGTFIVLGLAAAPASADLELGVLSIYPGQVFTPQNQDVHVTPAEITSQCSNLGFDARSTQNYAGFDAGGQPIEDVRTVAFYDSLAACQADAGTPVAVLPPGSVSVAFTAPADHFKAIA